MTETGPMAAPRRLCYLCGSSHLSLLIEVEGRQVWRCEDCGLGETAAEVAEPRYDAAYLRQQAAPADPSPEQVERAVRIELKRVRRLRRAAPGRRLMEIGFGRGYFLEAARRSGFEVRGIEVSSAAAEFCTQHFRLPVEVASVGEFEMHHASVDVIAAWHVLEHLADPLAALRKVRGWLSPQGIIALEVPNYQSYDARALGAAWQGWQPQYHRWHFCPATLARMLRDAGFTVRAMWHPPSSAARERLKRIPLIALLRRPLARLHHGTGLGVIAAR